MIGVRVIMILPRRLYPSTSGFTLIEMIVVIAILAIVAGAMAPLSIRMIDGSRQDLTLKRQQLIYQAVFGDSSAHGSGFLSDIGRIPGGALTELAVQGSLPSYSIQPCGVGMGWRGPYLLEGVDGAGQPMDGWGTPMDFANGQIRSAGPDHSMITTADNLYYPSTPITINNINGSIAIATFALDNSTAQPIFVPAGGQATVYFAQNGSTHSMTASSLTGSYIFPAPGVNFPQGIHAISVTGDPDGVGPQASLTRTITVFCPGGGTAHQTVALR
jgi:prepilin-type N-terminal cleavage/methylation domain-containing protein